MHGRCRRQRDRRHPVAADRRTARDPYRWNVYRAQPRELADRDGSFIPFAQTKAEREETGDPRPSLEEHYGNREAYVAKIKAAAEALVAERLLLPSDTAAYVKAAGECDRF